MKNKKWFQTDLVYVGTKVNLLKSPSVAYSYENLGRFTFGIHELKDVKIQVTTKGKLGLFYPEDLNYKKILNLITPLLLDANNKTAKIIEEIKIKNRVTQKDFDELELERVIDNLRFVKMRDPTILDISYQVGEIPEKVREAAFRLAPKIKWKDPSEEEVKEAELKIKEVFQITALLQHFRQEVVFTRPAKQLGGQKWKNVLERAKYASKHEKEKLPKIKFNEETEERIEFEFVWPRVSKYFGDYPEYYYKKKKQLSGNIWFKEQAKKLIRHIKKQMEDHKEEK